MVEMEKAIRQAMETGRVEMGLDSTLKAAMTGRARLVIVSNKCPADRLSDLEHYSSMSGVTVFRFQGNSADLGRICRKPFQVASLAVIDPGESSILSLAKGG